MDHLNQYLQLVQNWLLTQGPDIVAGLIILIVGRWLVKGISVVARKSLTKSGLDQTLVRFLQKLIYYGLLTAVFITAMDQAGIKATSFIAILGAAGLAIGLALKDSLTDFASGIMLILFRPFQVNDVVTVAGITGKVERIDIFNTVILTFDNQKNIIPNTKITSNIITNISAMPTRRIDLTIGIGYDDDLLLAKNILKEIVAADDRILSDPAPIIAVSELADSSVNFIVFPWVKASDYGAVRFDLIEKIKLTFDEKGISIPYPQQDVHIHHHKTD